MKRITSKTAPLLPLFLASLLMAATLSATENSHQPHGLTEKETISETPAQRKKSSPDHYVCGQYIFQKLSSDQPLILTIIDLQLEALGFGENTTERIIPEPLRKILAWSDKMIIR